jgi:hypothetical protein
MAAYSKIKVTASSIALRASRENLNFSKGRIVTGPACYTCYGSTVLRHLDICTFNIDITATKPSKIIACIKMIS